MYRNQGDEDEIFLDRLKGIRQTIHSPDGYCELCGAFVVELELDRNANVNGRRLCRLCRAKSQRM